MKFLIRYIFLVVVLLLSKSTLSQTNITIAVQTGSNDTICNNGNTQLVATVTNCANPSYQWYKNGVAISSGGTGSTISLNAPSGVGNGDVITCVQTNSTAPCSLDTSNGITIYYKSNQSLTLNSAAGTNVQTVCQYLPIVNISYALVGATAVSASGLPPGLSVVYNGGNAIITGSPTQNGTFNYQLQTTGTGLCGSTAQVSGTITVTRGGSPILSPTGSTQSVIFNGQNYLVRCINASNASIQITNGTLDYSNVTQYKIKWGDTSSDTTFTSFPGTISHNYTNGFYTLTFTITSVDNCVSSIQYGIFVGNSPQGTLGNPGNLSGCGPFTKTFPITNTNINVPGTTYRIDFGDGTILNYTHPAIPDSVTHTYNTSSCGQTTSTGQQNAYAASMRVVNPCDEAISTISPIRISTSPTPRISTPRSIYCVNETVSLLDNSIQGGYISGSSCLSGSFKYWTITPATGWTTASNLGNNGGNPNDASNWTNGANSINVVFTTPGSYTISLRSANDCNLTNPKNVDTVICVTSVPTSSFTTPIDTICAGNNLSFTNTSSTPTCSSNVYTWSVTRTNTTGCTTSAAPTYVSGTNSTSQNPVLSFSNPGRYVVSLITSINGTTCSSTAFTKTIIVKDKPTVSINPIAPICQNLNIIPSATSSCYTTNATYAWTFQNGSPATASTLNPGTVQMTGTGSQAITLRVTNECGFTDATTNVTVNPSPTISNIAFTNPTACASNTGSISFNVSPTTGSFTVSYTKNGTAQPTTILTPVAGIITISNLGAGLYDNIRVTLNSCASNNLGPITLSDPTKPATPVLTGNTPICSGGTLNLGFSNTYMGTVTYAWTGPNGFANSSASPTINNITAAGTGTYNLSVRINGCNSDPGTIAIQVNQTPAAPTVTTPVTYCQNATVSALTANGTNLIWYTNVSLTNGSNTAPTPSTTTVGTTTYYVIDSSSAGCKSSASTINVVVNATPVISNSTFANPTACATNTGSISFNVTPTSGTYTVRYTKNGATPTTINNVSPISGVITISNLGAGTYTNIFVSQNNCPSNSLGPITLNDPTPPNTPVITAPSTICSGSSLSLSATTSSVGTATYQWTGPSGYAATGANVSIANVATRFGGVYSVTATIAGCTSIAGTATVVIDSTPARPSITSNTPVCTDSTLNLFATTASSGTMTYNWTGANGFISTSQNPSITAVTTANAGVYTVTATSTINTNCISQPGTHTVVINQTPTISSPTFTNPTQCATTTGSISFNVLPATGTFTVTYTKNSSTQTVSLSPISGVITINNLSAGIYNNIRVALNNCPSNQLGPITLVDPNPPATPVVAGVDSICSGNTLTLTATTTSMGTATYNWIYPNGTANIGQTISIPNIAVKDSGIYRVTVTIANCISSAATKHIRVDSTPAKPIIVSNSPVCIDSTIRISTTSIYPFAVSYNWTFATNAISTNQSFIIPNAQTANAGFYKLVVTSTKNCVALPDSVNVVINPTPVINLQDSTNPSLCATPTGNIKLSGLLPNTPYQIFYTINATVKTQNQTANSMGILTIDTLRAGTYSNIFVVLNGCPSLPVGAVTLEDPNPPVTPIITAVDSICSGNNLSLSAATSSVGLATYTWTFPNGFTTTGQNISINNIPTFLGGTFSVTATINSCKSLAGTKIIRVDSTPVRPTIVSNSPICTNGTLNLTSSTVSPGAMTYSWTGANRFTSTLQNPIKTNMQLVDAGNYTVTYTSVVGGCVSPVATTTVVVHPTPTVNPVRDTTYKDGVPSGIIAFSGSIAGTTFNWANTNPSIGLAANGTGNISFTTSNTTAFPISGTITVTPSTSFCTGLPTSFIITVNPTPKLTSLLNDTICTNTVFNYQATSSTPSVKFTWTRNVVAGISNAASSSTDSLGTISETLINTTNTLINVPYTFKLYHLGTVSTQDVILTVYPNAKAVYTYVNNKLCAPGLIDTNNVVLQPYPAINANYLWYANTILLGTGTKFPGYTILNNGDSITIKLVATSKKGCQSDSIFYKFYTVKRPTVSFTKSTSQGCGPLAVTFTNTTTPLAEPNYLWDFGNGTTSNLVNPTPVIYNADVTAKRRDTTYFIRLKAFNQCDTIFYLDSVKVRPQPLALFQPDTTIGCSPFRFRAFNNSLGTPNNYSWDFGNGNTLTNNTNGYVTNVFSTAVRDTFTVKLIAQNECGIDSFKVDVVVLPNAVRPFLIIDGNTAAGCAPQVVKMVNNSTNANRFVLNYGDGSPLYISTKVPDTLYHTYANAGTYVVSLLASNGCSDSTTNQTVTFYQKPSASFTIPKTTYCAKEAIAFTNTSATGLSYEWLFADGNTATTYNTTHSYANAGTYIAKLVVRNIVATGITCTDTARVTITVIANPIATISSNALPQNCAPFTFNGTTTQSSGNAVNWYFGNPFSTDTTRVGNTATHIFTVPGTFTIRQIVINQNGCSDTAKTFVNVIETPQAKFVLSDTLICTPGKVVNALNQTTYTPLDAVDYKWLVNGFVQANSRNFSNNYTASPNITTAVVNNIQLISTNSFGCADTADARLTIQPKPQPNFTTNVSTGCVPLTLNINNTSTYANIFKWYVNNVLVSTDSLPINQVLTLPSTSYIIKLVADHRLGCGVDSILKPITTFSKPQAAIRINNRTSCTGVLTVQFNDLSTVVGSTISGWNWNFGNGTSSPNQNPNYTYSIAGQYTASLVATDARGCKSDTAFVTLKNFGKPTSRFSVNNVCLNASIAPINLSTLGYGSTAFTLYQWNFGDGTITTGFAPTHAYSVEGNYTIRLITTSDSSCVPDTAVLPIKVIGKPKANFSVTSNCINVATRFIDQSLIGFADNGIGTYNWIFGNGNFSNAANPTTTYSSTGMYPVRLIVAGSLCPTLKDTIDKTITVYRSRNSLVYPRIETVRNSPTPLQAQAGGIDYLWSPATGLNNTSIQNPIANYDATAPNILSYNIAITDSVGCTVIDKQEVWIFSQPDILVPTAFTPNGDGANDVLLPFYVSINRLLFFRVYDRWGKQIFETSQIGKAWDGTQNGKPMPMDTYVWVAEGISKGGNKVARKGNVTLIRE